MEIRSCVFVSLETVKRPLVVKTYHYFMVFLYFLAPFLRPLHCGHSREILY